ncbi:MAG: toll/interleukin-1 receptor domain-containing protein [Caldimonas sp.]
MPWQVFYSYSHKDEPLRDQLATALAPLRQKKLIVEWHDRRIDPGVDWDSQISARLDAADLVLVLLSPDFLASEYCFGVEMEQAFSQVKAGRSKVLPILARPCLWEESRFSALQMIPRDARPIASSASVDDALKAVSLEIRDVVAQAVPAARNEGLEKATDTVFDSSLDLVRRQIHAYARLYEKTRQRMRASNDRTAQMEGIFQKMRGLSTATYPLLPELRRSPSPGDRLAAVAILQTFSDEASIDFLTDLIGREKPFVGYHAARALRFAAGALDSTAYPTLAAGLERASAVLEASGVRPDSDRRLELTKGAAELDQNIAAGASSLEGDG